jgi:hypothetical protein
MLLNEFLEWIRDNVKTLIVVFIGMLVISVFIGILSGSAKRRAEVRTTFSPEQLITEKEPEEAELELLMPEPVMPFESEASEYSFFFNADYFNVNELELLPIKTSDLLKNRGIGKEDDVRSFRLGAEELDVLTMGDELSEP